MIRLRCYDQAWARGLPRLSRYGLGVGILTLGVALPAHAQTPGTVELTAVPDPTMASTFSASPQPATLRDVMGSVLATADPFQMQTVLSQTVLASCRSMRPDLPDAVIQPAEVADRVGILSAAIFEGEQVNMSFRTTTGAVDYVLTVDGSQADSVEVSSTGASDYVVLVTGAPMTVIRNAEESFHCAEAVNFRLVLGR